MKPSRRSLAPEQAMRDCLESTLDAVANLYQGCKYGVSGSEGYRKSTDLKKLAACIRDLSSKGILDPSRTTFLDLGCADGRVNVMMSYFVRCSIGIEIDSDILAEYEPRLQALRDTLSREGLVLPPDNLFLTAGSSLHASPYERIANETGIAFGDIDLFYTYITLHDRFAQKIRREAANGACYLVYGFHRVLPAYEGLATVIRDVGGQGIAALYRKGT